MGSKKIEPLKIRCSALSNVMTNGRGKNAGMGETAKTYLKELWIKENFGKQKIIRSKEMTKGNLAEADSITLAGEVTNRIMLKNTKHFSNEYLTGTPDVLIKDLVIDLKTSWDIWTFQKAELIKAYEWQLRGYMMLVDAPKAELTYALVNTPANLIMNEQKKAYYDFDCDEDNPEYVKQFEQIEKNMLFDDIPAEQRIKTFTIERDLDIEEDIKIRILEARQYFNTITL